LAADLPKEGGLDLTRYEADALEPPNRTFPDSDEQRPELLAAWRTALDRAYVSSSYLTGRNANLALLETYGKNAWLVGNWEAEAELTSLEADLKEVKAAAENLAAERSARQEGAKAELQVLEESWRKGVGGIVEVQVAAEGLRGEVLESRKKGAGN
jgi:pre-mRNA-splicing factor SPF27